MSWKEKETEKDVCILTEKIFPTGVPPYREGIIYYMVKLLKKESVEPILLIKVPYKDKYLIMDGHHRFLAMKSFNFQCIPSTIMYLPKEITMKSYQELPVYEESYKELENLTPFQEELKEEFLKRKKGE